MFLFKVIIDDSVDEGKSVQAKFNTNTVNNLIFYSVSEVVAA